MKTKTEKKSVFVICSVRKAHESTRQKLVAYKYALQERGYKVHLPHLDTNQQASGYEICVQNTTENIAAIETHMFYDMTSEGSHFDLGVKFVDIYFHPEKVFYVIEYMKNDLFGIETPNHLNILFDSKFEGYQRWIHKLEEMMQKDTIPIIYIPKNMQESHIELGMAFALYTLFPEKRVNVVHNGGIIDENGEYLILFERSFGTMITEWETKQKER